ncbi:MAG: DNA internalization-related competence protein ComEC/Rec2 [Magnetococcales bacterium]|nr:DNA internalization-related competence protein ComEC/Rec2 [Magnetococcales bacterium]
MWTQGEETQAVYTHAKIAPVEAVRRATRGSTLFLIGMIAMLLALFHIRGEGALPPVAASWMLLSFAVWIQVSRKSSLWPAVFGMMAAIIAVNFNLEVPRELPNEAYERPHRLQGVIMDRVDRYDSVLLDLGHLDWPEKGWSSSDQIRLTVHHEQVGMVQPGDRIEAKVRLRRPEGNRVPGSLDYGAWLQRHGYVATGYLARNASLIPIGYAQTAYWNRLRSQISRWIVSRLPPTSEGLAEGLLVGKRGLISERLNDALLISGTYHLLAISGQHLAMVAGWSFLLLRWMLVLFIPASRRWDMKRFAAILTLIPLIIYSQLAGWSISTQRATLVTGLLLLGLFLWRRILGINMLIISATILLFFWPAELLGASFHLTFVAVAALLFFFNVAPFTGSRQRRFWRSVVMILFMGLATAPVVAYHFHRFTPYGFPGNLVGVPWIGFVSLPLGFAALIAHGILPGLANSLLDAMGWSLEVFVHWIDWLSHLPQGWQRLPGPSLWGISWSVALFAASFIMPWKRGRVWVAGLALMALFWPREGPAPGRLHVAILDVGQALAMVVRSPDERWMVVDAGGVDSPRFNVGEGVISPYLWHHGARELERIVISHPQKDHMVGAISLLRNFPVKELWLGTFPDEEKNNPYYRRLIQMAMEQGVNLQRIDHKTLRTDAMTLWAMVPELDWEKTSINDRSVMTGITLGRHQFLFPGDIEAPGEAWFVEHHPQTRYSVVMAPHHGSSTSSTPEFIANLQPRHVVFSCDASRNKKIPHPRVLDRWRKAGSQLWRTDHLGTIIWETDGNELWMQPPDRGG